MGSPWQRGAEQRVYRFNTGATITNNAVNADGWYMLLTNGTNYACATESADGGRLNTLIPADAAASSCVISWNNLLSLDIDRLHQVWFTVAANAVAANTRYAFGVCSNTNAVLNSVVDMACVRFDGSTTAVAQTKVGSTATTGTGSATIGNTSVPVTLRIDFSRGKSDVRFYVDNARQCETTSFNMAGYSSQLQPFIMAEKLAGANTNHMHLYQVGIVGTYAF